MVYQVIARKWRPQSFDEVTGQEHITQTLRNAIEHDRLHHAYLFSGARGVGKTTTARLLAKALNCHKAETPTLSPCRTSDPDACPSCTEIAESRSIDVLEIDAASNTGIDNVREVIIENLQVNPARDRFKAFIIDEVHQLSKPAFNALLKTLEEPPPNVVFIMATTELHKVPETITSRCQEFNFRTIAQQKIFERLRSIAEAEKIAISNDALRELARSGEGSMRDAQSNFDQVISFSGDRIEVADVTGALGMASRDVLIRAIEAVAGGDAAAQLMVVDEIVTSGNDLRSFARDLLALLRDLLVFKIAGNAETLLETSMLDEGQIAELASPFSERDLLRFFHSLAETDSNLKGAAHPRYVLETGLVKLIEMRKLVSIESVIERLAILEDERRANGPTTAASGAVAKTAVGHPSGVAEKKTLVSEPDPKADSGKAADEHLLPEVSPGTQPSVFHGEPPDTYADEFPSEPIEENDPGSTQNSWDDLSFVSALPVRPTEISAERLEHFEHQRLDDAFEARLLSLGDRLEPIRIAPDIFAESDENKAVGAAAGASSNSFTRAEPAYFPPVSKVEDLPIPVLGDDPTDEELRKYAESHPDIRRIARILRAEIVEVTRL